tara:strand:+ start:10461 stop:11162 length:702 start_codon:yes stop_codon:yes gene_type:complete
MKNDNLILKKFENDDEISNFIISKLIDITKKKSEKNVLISGGKTFYQLYRTIINQKIDLSKLTFIICDERLVSPNSKLSNNNSFYKKVLNKMLEKNRPLIIPLPKNYHLMKKDLLCEKFIKKLPNPSKISLSLLGVGLDGHIASIFNKDVTILYQNKYLLVSKRKNEKFNRISVNIDYLSKIERKYLVIHDIKKKKVFDKIKDMKSKNSDLIVHNLIISSREKVTLLFNKKII